MSKHARKKSNNRLYLITISVNADWKFISEKLMLVKTMHNSVSFHLISFIPPLIRIHGKKFSQTMTTTTKIYTKKLVVLFRSHCWSSLSMKDYFEIHWMHIILARFYFFVCINSNLVWMQNFGQTIRTHHIHHKQYLCVNHEPVRVSYGLKWKTNCTLSQLLHVMSEKIYAVKFHSWTIYDF